MGSVKAPPAVTGREWKNYLGEQPFLPALTFAAQSEAEVAAVVARAAAADERVHGAGAGHASSPLVRTDGYLIVMDRVRGVTRLSPDELARGVRGDFVRALAGTRIHDLNDALAGMGLAMRNLGSAAFQSIAGAVATGTHGSGASLGALCDLVRSVDLVDGSGARVRVEPTPGFTRADRVPRGVRHVVDDDAFHSVVVGVGVAGLVTSLVLDVRPAYLLSETRTLATWEELEASDTIDDDIVRAEHYELWLNPYARGGRHTALVTIRKEADPATPRRPRTDPLPLRFRIVRTLITLVLDAFQKWVPWALDEALGSQATKRPWVDRSDRIFDLGAVNDMPALATEWFFPFSRWKDAVRELLAEAERLSLRPRAIGGVPFGVRFVRASPHFLAMSRGARDDVFCTIELPVYDNEHDRRTLLHGYERVAEKHGGRPHWGQAHRARPKKLEARWPEFRRWQAVRESLDPSERFANYDSWREGLTLGRVPHPVIDDALAYYDARIPREVLAIDPDRVVHIDRRRFRVEASATKFVSAFQRALLQPGALVARRFEVLRSPDRVAKPFILGERFQGRFALDKQLLEDTLPHPRFWTKILRWLDVDAALRAVESADLSNYGEVRELAPTSIRYVYLTGTPFAGESHFTIAPIDDSRCEYTEQITFQPTNEMNALAMKFVGLRLHNQVVFGQVEAAADDLGVAWEPLDPDDTGTPNVQ